MTRADGAHGDCSVNVTDMDRTVCSGHGTGVLVGDPDAPHRQTASCSSCDEGWASRDCSIPCCSGHGGPSAHSVVGFEGDLGDDLSGQGWTQCYGWDNVGVTIPPSATDIEVGCGAASELLFAGRLDRSSSSPAELISFPVELPAPLSEYCPFPTTDGEQLVVETSTLKLVVHSGVGSDCCPVTPTGIVVCAGRSAWSTWFHFTPVSHTSGGYVLDQSCQRDESAKSLTSDSYYIYQRTSAGVITDCSVDGTGMEGCSCEDGWHGRDCGVRVGHCVVCGDDEATKCPCSGCDGTTVDCGHQNIKALHDGLIEFPGVDDVTHL